MPTELELLNKIAMTSFEKESINQGALPLFCVSQKSSGELILIVSNDGLGPDILKIIFMELYKSMELMPKIIPGSGKIITM